MPVYSYECKCGQVKEEFRSVDNRLDTPDCECGGKCKLIITPVCVHGADVFNSHYDISLGAFFESESHKKKFLAKHGRKQESGLKSPRTSSSAQIICNKEQALKIDKSCKA